MSSKWFVSARNMIITLCGMVLTAFFYIRYGAIVKPLVFTAVVLSFSMLHAILFNKSETTYKLDNGNNMDEKLENVNLLVDKINQSIKSIKDRSKANSRLILVTKFMDTIEEFEDVLPDLIKDYKRGAEFAYKNASIHEEMMELEKKTMKAKGSAKQIYEKALNENRSTMQEIENIKNSLEESESKLYYMLSTLQKIEAIIEVTELDAELSDENTDSLNTHLETFSENLKDVIRSIRL